MSEKIYSSQDAATPIVIVGHVDHGKSTLIGRLLHDTDSLQDGKVAQIIESSKKRGLKIEWSFLLDSLQIERDQGVTVDSTRIPFRLGQREFVIVDAPGHRQFLRNMITGAADAEAAVLVVDAQEGAREQTRRHAMLLHLIGIRHVIVLLNKVDLLDFDQAKVEAVEKSVTELLNKLGLEAALFVPASARDGDNIASRSERSPWYKGPTLTEALASVPSPASRSELALRLPVQDVYRFDNTRYVAGRVERGRVRVGDTVIIGTQKTPARIASIESWHTAPHVSASAGQSIAVTLEPDVIPDRGDLLHHADAAPMEASRVRVRLFWLRQEPLRVGEHFRLRLATAEHAVTVTAIDKVVDLDDLTEHPGTEVPPEGFAEIVLSAAENIQFDPFTPGTTDGRGVLVDRQQRIVGGAPIIGPATIADGEKVIHPSASTVTVQDRERAKGHKGSVFWLTGLSGSGKSTLARAAETRLFADGVDVTVLDGDTLRAGLCKDLGFSEADRTENVRRAAEVARLLRDAGQVVIVALISPLRSDRDLARQIIGDGFEEVFVDADLGTCEQRDPKGLYAAARAGKISGFTGIDAPYEAPAAPALRLVTGKDSVEAATKTLVTFVENTVRNKTGARAQS
ncbi:adenylyl-sulfate kinase [Acetobacter pasteurianus]|uniref:Adenylyl-sulfate kinase n=3 Tax=Acetobacter pasteurianus TaxID=438 RepID=C7JH56_ACEP3|nr:adenylyl-sulfate kinase [Acetobacter pasteurianus]ASC04343.1 Sulfate adenylyltransferase [Acetobacter pasteurianus subsp. pasteurianus]QHM90498.1 adenylyl-sulfate kinase [Acetobacter pasteurianus]BAH99310.1 sulfate adenylyltransferase subunit 1 [Acetobacter pasteurianus IFO 3283-01]BAI02363.1 sulfate adenylyltransferase subunit 1 [Acetobacter pasteurianus IFO 3283-03]BAI05409.1 sulfate adenylyltransferase subunit 1 [Acetobacter pasteurianus IFO 3283-07]